MINAVIQDGFGKDKQAKVTQLGQLVVAPLEYDLTIFKELAENDTAYNFYEPQAGKQFVITGIIMTADQQVGTVTGATVIIYEGSSASTLTVDKVLFQIELPQQEIAVVSPLNILVNAGKYINGKTDDDDIHMTITGYYIDEIT